VRDQDGISTSHQQHSGTLQLLTQAGSIEFYWIDPGRRMSPKSLGVATFSQ